MKINLREDERQLILLALAELSIARPGWVEACAEVALLMDIQDNQGRPNTFEMFRRNHSNHAADILSNATSVIG